MTELFDKLLKIGQSNPQHESGLYCQQLLDLHQYIYITESTPHPYEPTYFPMFVDCVILAPLWKKIKPYLEENHFSYQVLNFQTGHKTTYSLIDIHKRKLLFEMLGKWWFFHDTPIPSFATPEAVAFRNQFFRQKYAYLPEKFRKLANEMDFNMAISKLTEEEHAFLDDMIMRMKAPHVLCGCINLKKSAFHLRLEEPEWNYVPDLGLEGMDKDEVYRHFCEGKFLYLSIINYYDCMDRGLYKKLNEIFTTCTEK